MRFFSALVLIIALIPAYPGIAYHRVFFLLDPALIISEAPVYLARYVTDINYVLAKNTRRRLDFDQETGIVLSSSDPFSHYHPGHFRDGDFDIRVYVQQGDLSYSHGGMMDVDVTDDGCISGMYWTRIYDPRSLGGDDEDYWRQINNMLHELAHVFGAGVGEYYNLSRVKDTTGVEPRLDIDSYDAFDPYWSAWPDALADPLLRSAHGVIPGGRLEFLAWTRFSDLTAAIMDGDYRNGVPEIPFTVRVVDSAGQPVEGAVVRAWRVKGIPGNPAELVLDAVTDSTGAVRVEWGSPAHNNYEFLRLVKVYNGPASAARYVSIFDCDGTAILDGQAVLEVAMTVEPYRYFFPAISVLSGSE